MISKKYFPLLGIIPILATMKKLTLKWFLSVVLLMGSVCSWSQDKMPYRLFTKEGAIASYSQLLQATQNSQITLFGEYHDNPICHWLELELAKDVSEIKPIVMGAEMIETDNQAMLNKYLNGEIDQKQLDSTARLWPNHKTDYKPLVDFAKEKKIPFVATNVPRRFAGMVYKQGFEALATLTAAEKLWVAPLPIAYDASLPGYVRMIEEMGGHGGANLPKAQALKDATMASFILKNLQKNSVFIHYNGTYHSDYFDGIYWYLKKGDPKLTIITIATVTQESILTLNKENYNKADFIIVIDEDVTKTY